MAATLGKDPDELAAELIRAIAQDLAHGKSPEDLKEALGQRGLARDQASRLVESVVQARKRRENSAEGRAEKRSHAQSRMLKGALWGGGGVMVTLMSLGSGEGRIFFGAAIYGAYLFLGGLIMWGGNVAQLGDDEELIKGPHWLKGLRVGSDVPELRPAVPAPAPPVPAARRSAPVSMPRPLPPPAATVPRPPLAVPKATPPGVASRPRNWEGTMITRLFAVLFLANHLVELLAPYDPFDEFGLGGEPGGFAVFPSVTFMSALFCLAHVVRGGLGFRLGALPAYHLAGVVLVYQLWSAAEMAHALAVAHSAVGLAGGLAWLGHTEQLRKKLRPMRMGLPAQPLRPSGSAPRRPPQL